MEPRHPAMPVPEPVVVQQVQVISDADSNEHDAIDDLKAVVPVAHADPEASDRTNQLQTETTTSPIEDNSPPPQDTSSPFGHYDLSQYHCPPQPPFPYSFGPPCAHPHPPEPSFYPLQPPHPPIPPPIPPPVLLESHPALAMASYYETRMRDHAAAFANAAAGAAWAAAHIAAAAAEIAAGGPRPPPPLGPVSLPAAGSWNHHRHHHPTMMPSSSVFGGGVSAPPAASFMIPTHIPFEASLSPYGHEPLYQDAAAPPLYDARNQQHPQHFPPVQPPHEVVHHQEQQAIIMNRPNDFDDDSHAYAPTNTSSSSCIQKASSLPPRNSRRKNRPSHHPFDTETTGGGAGGGGGGGGGCGLVGGDAEEGRDRKKRVQHRRCMMEDESVVPRRVVLETSRSQQTPRRRLRSDNDSSSSGSSALLPPPHSSSLLLLSSSSSSSLRPQPNNNHPNPSGCAGSGSGGGGGGGGGGSRPCSSNSHHHKKARSDASLLGKTGVSSLYEWCSKRQKTPVTNVESHLDEYTCTIYLEGLQVGGVGRGRTKNAAKQDAARKAVISLVPGVVFDSITGVLIDLPLSHNTTTSVVNNTGMTANDSHSATVAALSSLEDLAPNLAKLLAIGHDDDDEIATIKSNSVKDQALPSNSTKTVSEMAQHKRLKSSFAMSASNTKSKRALLHVYPGTSTTSEEEDESAYYECRGASACSTLLHAMVQIDDRIRDPPEFQYEMMSTTFCLNTTPPTLTTGSTSASPYTSENRHPFFKTTQSHRGLFTCTATLCLHPPQRASVSDSPHDDGGNSNDVEGYPNDEVDDNPNDVEGNRNDDGDVHPNDDSNHNIDDGNHNDDGDNEKYDHKVVASYQRLKATAIGSTKKESRQMASAKLLALLFPQCKTMVEVKAAAEAAREDYAASKCAMKQQLFSRKNRLRLHGYETPSRASVVENEDTNHRSASVVAILTAKPNHGALVLPAALRNQFKSLLTSKSLDKMSDAGSSQKNTTSICTYDRRNGASVATLRQMSRQRQLDVQVERALQNLYEQDEDGKILPQELTENDVGRTVLRRGLPDDLGYIKKMLLHNTRARQAPFARKTPKPDGWHNVQAEPSTAINQILASQLWSSSCIVLLLCRAIGAYEDPPLGCAVLTLGFSLEMGRQLHVNMLVTERHLPNERFMECLQAFSRVMNCTLHQDTGDNCGEVLSERDLRTILSSYIGPSSDSATSSSCVVDSTNIVNALSASTISTNDSRINNNRISSSPLPSVLEESEVSESSSSSEKRPPTLKRANKPSKRSRFA